jgi:hypothetical protein
LVAVVPQQVSFPDPHDSVPRYVFTNPISLTRNSPPTLDQITPWDILIEATQSLRINALAVIEDIIRGRLSREAWIAKCHELGLMELVLSSPTKAGPLA